MKAKDILLVSVAGSVVAPVAASAADLPVKAAPQAAPAVAVAPSWAGPYLGVHAGVAWHKAKAEQPGNYYGSIHFSDTKTGFAGGGLVGYNLQSGAIVAGLEADLSGLDAKVSGKQPAQGATNSFSSDMDWMATLRARLGIANGNLLTFITAGVAWADIKNKFILQSCCTFAGTTTWTDDKTRTGIVLGGGFDYMFTPNWIGRIEGLWADFGKHSINDGKGNAVGSTQKNTTFKNKVVVVRGALLYKF